MHVVLILVAAIWFKGNTHVHTSESDGDAAPAVVARWYADRGYDFIVITDHDKVTRVDADGILVITGEEVTDSLPKKPLHVNALGLTRAVAPQRAKSVVENLQRNVDAIRAAGGIPAVNHPNFGWAFGYDELAQLERVGLLEIASGHPLVNMQGPPSVESMWDELLMSGKRWYGIAVDDSHHFVCPPPLSAALPGQAWIVVRAEQLDAASILNAIERGEFYASNGPELVDYRVDASEMLVWIRDKGGARFRTQFIGDGGRVLHESATNPSIYCFRGDERYVRAKVIDSNGNTAWMQPVFVYSRP